MPHRTNNAMTVADLSTQLSGLPDWAPVQVAQYDPEGCPDEHDLYLDYTAGVLTIEPARPTGEEAMTAEPLPLEDEMTAAAAIVRIGLERLRDAGARTADVAPHLAALKELRGTVLASVADVLGVLAVSVSEVDHDDIDTVVEQLDEAAAYAQDSTGNRIDRAVEMLTPMLPTTPQRND